jgi:DUF1680 family protein
MFRIRKWMLLCLILAGIVSCACMKHLERECPIQPVPFTNVRITDAFWLPRIETNRKVTIHYAFRMNKETGRIDNLRKAAGFMEGPYTGRRFNDSDIFKIMEAAAYSLAQHSDPVLEAQMDSLVGLIGHAQEDDGYLYSARTVDPHNPAPGAGSERWIHLQGSHELYNVGHMYEAAVAYWKATGKREFLNIALKNAELVNSVFGPGKRQDTPGHQEIEIGLVKLYRATGNRTYLDLAEFFLDQRGRPHASLPYPDSSVYAIYNGRLYKQDHIPVLKQTEAVGHAVRAAYMYAAMADIAALRGNRRYRKAVDTLWEDVVKGKLYLTGGIGARYVSEAFGDAYELPNDSAYTETCAAVGNVLWNHRMFLLHGESKYVDVLERSLYNGLLSGVSLTGDRFFYQNPLESAGGYQRSGWFDCACCPPNLARFLPSLSGTFYAVEKNKLYVNLYAGNKAHLKIDGNPVEVVQETEYPWDGRIRIVLKPEHEDDFIVALRIPGWTRDEAVPSDLYRFLGKINDPFTVTVNGELIQVNTDNGYACIRRTWQTGDEVILDLPMPVRTILSHDRVEGNRGRIAFQRGPLVYCAEEPDNGKVLHLKVKDMNDWNPVNCPDLLGGIVTLEGTAWNGRRSVRMKLIPYYAWANRGGGEMAVWLRKAESDDVR